MPAMIEEMYSPDFPFKDRPGRDRASRGRRKKTSPTYVTVRGVLTPSRWADDGEPEELTLSTDGEAEYVIEGGTHFDMLSGHCPALIQASGRVREFRDRVVLEVSRYEILNR